MTRPLLVDSWEVRRWLLWPWCAAHSHREVFWLENRWNAVTVEKIGRCSCGRRTSRHPVGSSS